MKKMGKILSMAITIFLVSKNYSHATSYEVETQSSGIADKFPFILGAILVVCVLFLAYKMDKSSESGTIKKKKKAPKSKKVAKQEKQETEIYAEENKADMPYEIDENETYEQDDNIDISGLDEDTEYEQDDISLFDSESNQESKKLKKMLNLFLMSQKKINLFLMSQ